MNKSKYTGLVFDGRWEVIGTEPNKTGHTKYILKNIDNGRELKIVDSTFKKIREGKITISRHIKRLIFKERRWL